MMTYKSYLFLTSLLFVLSSCGHSSEGQTKNNQIDKNKQETPKQETPKKETPKEESPKKTSAKFMPMKTGTPHSKFLHDDKNTTRGLTRSYTKSNDFIADNITTLQWQDTQMSEDVTWEEAQKFCQTLTINGVADWRLPTMRELLTLVDLANTPTISETFTQKKETNYWSITEYQPDTNRYAYYVNFKDGTSYEYTSRDPYEKMKKYAVRCVRGSYERLHDALKRDDSKEVVIDAQTHLMWSDDKNTSEKRVDLESAINYCENATIAGYDDWHLPNINELYTIADRSHYDPAVHDAFKYLPTFGEKEKDFHEGNYWSTSYINSNTQNGKTTHYMRTLNIQNGASRPCRHYFSGRMHTKCVRTMN